jgi:hypothetical protein
VVVLVCVGWCVGCGRVWWGEEAFGFIIKSHAPHERTNIAWLVVYESAVDVRQHTDSRSLLLHSTSIVVYCRVIRFINNYYQRIISYYLEAHSENQSATRADA